MKKCNEYEVSFTFFISLEEEESIATKDELLDLLDTINEVSDYDVDNDGEDWCINCIAIVNASKINSVFNKMEKLLKDTNISWDYHYIKGLNTSEYWQP